MAMLKRIGHCMGGTHDQVPGAGADAPAQGCALAKDGHAGRETYISRSRLRACCPAWQPAAGEEECSIIDMTGGTENAAAEGLCCWKGEQTPMLGGAHRRACQRRLRLVSSAALTVNPGSTSSVSYPDLSPKRRERAASTSCHTKTGRMGRDAGGLGACA
jgi:hypothetical protein